MTRFFFQARRGPEECLQGHIEECSRDAVALKIVRSGLVPTHIEAIPPGKPGKEKAFDPGAKEGTVDMALRTGRRQVPTSPKVPYSDLELFTRHLGDLMDAGVPLLQGLDILERQLLRHHIQTVVHQVRHGVQNGDSLSEAVARFPRIFPPAYVYLVRAGEAGGQLPAVLTRLANDIEEARDIRAQVRTCLFYPLLIFVVGCLTVVFLLTFVIPRLAMIFEDFDAVLPLPTLALLGVSRFLKRFWGIGVGAAVFLYWLLRKVGTTGAGKLYIDTMKLRCPGLGRLFEEALLGRFIRTLATLLDSGVDMVGALQAACPVMDNELLQRKVRGIILDVKDGGRLADSFARRTLVSEDALSLVSVNEGCGRLPKGLFKLAGQYERRVRQGLTRMVSLMEPAFILVMGLVVGFVVLAMLMPLFRMNLLIN